MEHIWDQQYLFDYMDRVFFPTSESVIPFFETMIRNDSLTVHVANAALELPQAYQ